MQAAVDMHVFLLLLFVDELVLHRVLATVDHVLVRDGFAQVLPGDDGAAFDEVPVRV